MDSVTQLSCPHCGNTGRAGQGFSRPTPVCTGMPDGVPVPEIQQCLRCRTTLSPSAFTPGTDRHAASFAACPPERRAALAAAAA
jgi:hypothetical protein